jgi:hypothetical protein
MTTNLVPIKVTLPVDHYGDMVGYISGIGGWIDDMCLGERASISARVPGGAIPAIARWLIDNLPDRGECATLEREDKNV